MTKEECVWSLRKLIEHQEKMHQQDFYEKTPDGDKLLGKINPDNDMTYQTLLAALACVERSNELQPGIDMTGSRAESSAHVLRGLISYHERMTMGNYPERDFYLDALRYALSLVENEIKA